MGFNEAAGYLALSVTSAATGWLAAEHGLRPAPFLLGLAFAALGLGLGLSTVFVKETNQHAKHEARTHVPANGDHHDALTGRQIFTLTSFREKALSAAGQAGLVNNLNDARLGPVPDPVRDLRAGRCPHRRTRRLVPTCVVARAAGHRRTVRPMGPQTAHRRRNAAASRRNRHGRRHHRFHPMDDCGHLDGCGHRHGLPGAARRHRRRRPPTWRARAVGVYRLWRDLGYAVGALLAGITADLLGLRAAIWLIAAITAASGLVVAIRMYETHQRITAAAASVEG